MYVLQCNENGWHWLFLSLEVTFALVIFMVLWLSAPTCYLTCLDLSVHPFIFPFPFLFFHLLAPWKDRDPQSSSGFCARSSDPGEYALLLVPREGRYLIYRCRGKKGTLGMEYRAVFNIPVYSFPKGTITLHPVPGTINHLKGNWISKPLVIKQL